MDKFEMHKEVFQFVGECQKFVQAHDEYHSKETLEIEFGKKFAKIVACSNTPNTTQRIVWGFVALVDGATKDMGSWKQGDIFRAETWRKPSKHARGNIWDEHKGMKHIGVYGPHYMEQIKKNP